MFDMTLQRRKFPANVRVHIHKSENLILCISILLFGTASYSTTLVPNGLVTAQTTTGYVVPEGCSCSLVIAVMATGNLDAVSGAEIMELFSRLNKEKSVTILQVTHSAESASYSSRIVTLKDKVITG